MIADAKTWRQQIWPIAKRDQIRFGGPAILSSLALEQFDYGQELAIDSPAVLRASREPLAPA